MTEIKITFAEPSLPKDGALVVLIDKEGRLAPMAARVDEATGGVVSRAIAGADFKGRARQFLDIVAPHSLDVARVVLAGCGDASTLGAREAEDLGGAIYGRLARSGVKTVSIAADRPAPSGKLGDAELAARLAFGAQLASYRFDKYRTREKPEDKPTLRAVRMLAEGAAAARREHGPLDKIAQGVFLARDLVSEPANVLYPETLADECRKLAEIGVDVDVLGESEMAALGMGALLAVGHGSERESRLVVMQWAGAADRDAQPIALIGKGVTFDTGGISIKPAAGMQDMKWDMGGAAAVIGAMKAIAGRNAKANVVGIVGLVENMPSGRAQRPGDVVRSMSGQTIEVINTDAEGRLVLADAMWYCRDRFRPAAMVDLATLTGAIIVSLGHHKAGLFATDDALAEHIAAAGSAVGEGVWRMPLDEEYDKQIKSDIADMKNVGGRDGGSITAAQFLQRFTDGVPWAHLDIAGVAWSAKDQPTVPKGGVGWGVRLLDRLVADGYEKP